MMARLERVALSGLLLAAAGSPARAATEPPQAGPLLNSETLQGAAPYGTPIADDRIYYHVLFNQLEGRFLGGSYVRWEGEAWVGNDYNKLWIKTEGRYNAEGKGKVGDGIHEVLYDRPFSRFFNFQTGLRFDIDSKPSRTWLGVGVQGLAVGFWEVVATAYAREAGHFAVKTNARYDYMVTQRLVLQPQFETNWYTKTDHERGVGPGLASLDSGLRLRYEFSRKFAPYVGVTYQRFFGNTANLRREEGSAIDDFRVVAGFRVWY